MSRKKPKIIVWDLETGNLSADLSSIICFGWKILGSKNTHCKNTWDFKGWNSKLFKMYDDKELCKYIYNILSGADGMITHYGAGFDLKFLNTRLLYHGLPPLPPILNIDTWWVAKTKLKLCSNRLDNAAATFGRPQKTNIVEEARNRGLDINHKWHLWVMVSLGNKVAFRLMSDYCKQDVDVLEQLYFDLLPLIDKNINYNLFKSENNEGDKVEGCPSCGSYKMVRRGYRLTKAGRYRRYKCRACNRWSSGRKNICKVDLR
jgi:hypothetical protein